MLRISKLADYAVVILAYLALHPEGQNSSSIAQYTHISLPTVSKLLKLLNQQRWLIAHRGAQGGYTLAVSPENISIAEIITALDGNIALTECTKQIGTCKVESACLLSRNWNVINTMVHHSLTKITLAQMLHPLSIPL